MAPTAAGDELDFQHVWKALVGCEDDAPLSLRLKAVRHVSGEGDVRRLHSADWMIVVQLERQLE